MDIKALRLKYRRKALRRRVKGVAMKGRDTAADRKRRVAVMNWWGALSQHERAQVFSDVLGTSDLPDMYYRCTMRAFSACPVDIQENIEQAYDKRR